MLDGTGNKFNDLVDVLTNASMETVDILEKDGTTKKEQILNEEILWWKTLDVNSEKFSRLTYELKEWERMASLAKSNMPEERALQLGSEILGIGQSYRRSIDAKGSESRRDKNNAKATVFDKIGRNKVERVMKYEDAKSRSLWDGLTGKGKEEEEEYY